MGEEKGEIKGLNSSYGADKLYAYMQEAHVYGKNNVILRCRSTFADYKEKLRVIDNLRPLSFLFFCIGITHISYYCLRYLDFCSCT